MRILIVDDDPIFNFLTKTLIKSTGIVSEISIALNGLEAMQFIYNCHKDNSELPDLILLDINMPIMNGFEFLEEFKLLELPEKDNIAIAIVTSSSDKEDFERAQQFKIVNYFEKPLQKENILSVLTS